MKVLIVGAGAVGAVYGWHLHRAGHEVHFFVKAKYANEVSAGLTLHRLGRRATQRHEWKGPRVVTDTAMVARERWDQVWFTLSSDALRGELASQLLAAVGTATVVCLQPDLEDADYVRGCVGTPEQVVHGLINLISYQSPLPGTEGPDGIAYYLPSSPSPFSGSPQRVRDVVEALKAGGMSASAVPNVAPVAAAATALMQPLIAALEVNQWRLTTLPGSEALRLGLAAMREALAVAQRATGARTGRFRLLLRPWIWRLLLPLAARRLPLPLESYLHYHFSKVDVQTRLMLDTYIRLGLRQGQDTQALQSLRKALPTIVSRK